MTADTGSVASRERKERVHAMCWNGARVCMDMVSVARGADFMHVGKRARDMAGS